MSDPNSGYQPVNPTSNYNYNTPVQGDSNLFNTPAPAKYAGFLRRLAAVLLDGIVLSIASWIVFSLFGIGGSNYTAIENGENFSRSFTYYNWGDNWPSTVIAWLYYAFMESSAKQATLGKMILNIKVTDLEGRRISFLKATGRFLGKFLSALILGIGFLMVIFTGKKQGLHDQLAGTLVVKNY